jgi:hypothetical protein
MLQASLLASSGQASPQKAWEQPESGQQAQASPQALPQPSEPQGLVSPPKQASQKQLQELLVSSQALAWASWAQAQPRQQRQNRSLQLALQHPQPATGP